MSLSKEVNSIKVKIEFIQTRILSNAFLVSNVAVECTSKVEKTEAFIDIMDKIVVWLEAASVIIHKAFLSHCHWSPKLHFFKTIATGEHHRFIITTGESIFYFLQPAMLCY